MNGIHGVYLLFFYLSSVHTLCNMPLTWRGSWYQRGMNSLLEITVDHIQTKGHCLDVLVNQQYFLFTEKSSRCTRCLLFIERHSNLLQYRESECADIDELSNVNLCPNFIAPDAPLYTLHRNNSQAQSCPIHTPNRLTHLIKDGSTCSHSISSSFIGQCANDQQFRLHLSPCSTFQVSLDLQFVCVGTWIEGVHTYFVARILSSSNNQYACFHYSSNQKDRSPSFLLSMATDDSCRDLNSKYMNTVMTLTSTNHRENNSCSFDEQFQQTDWISLNQTQRMRIRSHDIDLQQEDFHQRLHCLEKFSPNNYRVRIFTNCDVTEQCLRMYFRTSNVVEMFIHECDTDQIESSLIFVKKFTTPSSCPKSIGHLTLESIGYPFQRKIHYELSVGCEEREKLRLSRDASITQTDTCLASWQSADSKSVYLIARSISSNSSYCLTFQLNERILIRNDSQRCSSSSSFSAFVIYSGKLQHLCSRSTSFTVNDRLLYLISVFLLTLTRVN